MCVFQSYICLLILKHFFCVIIDAESTLRVRTLECGVRLTGTGLALGQTSGRTLSVTGIP